VPLVATKTFAKQNQKTKFFLSALAPLWQTTFCEAKKTYRLISKKRLPAFPAKKTLRSKTKKKRQKQNSKK
jgi:hypothetical protein